MKLQKTVVIKHCELKRRGVHDVWWRNFHRRDDPEPAATD